MKATSEELLIFVTVVESGSFSLAADRLNMATSAVSRGVKRLENKFAISLMDRTTRQFRLTPEGEGYYQQARAILQQMNAAEEQLLNSRNAPSGLLKIDAATPVMLHLLTPLIRPFRDGYPQITLSLCSSETFINLIDRKVDIAIRAGTLSDSTLRARLLLTSYRRLVASPEYVSRYGTPETVAALARHHCLGFSEPATLNQWPLQGDDGEWLSITPTLSANSGETLKQLCLQGNGIASLSDFMVDEDIAAGRLVNLLTEQVIPVGIPVNAVYYSDNVVSHRIRAFIDFISQQLAKTPPRLT